MSLLRDDSAKEWFELPRKKYPKGRQVVIQELLDKNGNRCALCGDPINDEEMSIDHVYPVSKGGIESELQLTHKICNNLKGDFTIEVDCSWFKKERLRRGSKL